MCFRKLVTGGKPEAMKKPELTDVQWFGPRVEMDDASHLFGKCSECGETICVEKAVTDPQSTRSETTEMLYEAFRAHDTLQHSDAEVVKKVSAPAFSPR